jgi:26S proteasome regulatory subunit N12
MADNFEKAKAVFTSFKAAMEKEPCDLAGCVDMLGQLKMLLFTAIPTVGSGSTEVQQLARGTLELACFLSIRRGDLKGFERHVVQLKAYYTDAKIQSEENKYTILGLYLVHLLAEDRIGEFHTELELIPLDDYAKPAIRDPIQLERFLMEGNYVKVLEGQKNLPQKYAPFFLEKLYDTVRQKVGASLERSYENLPAQEAAKMLILKDMPALQEFAMKENERKARNEANDTAGDWTPSLARRVPLGLVRWEVKDGRLQFTQSNEKRMEGVTPDLMENIIGYATDLERII